jgi:hypothetical protein
MISLLKGSKYLVSRETRTTRAQGVYGATDDNMHALHVG